MAKAKPSKKRERVLSADRFELRDPHGRVRAVLGDIGDGERYVPGLMLFDRHGNERSIYAAYSYGCTLSFVSEGNTRVQLGVDEDFPDGDDDPRYDPAAFIQLASGDGEVMTQLRVHRDGRVESAGLGARCDVCRDDDDDPADQDDAE